ncbi:unnamed protein product [Amoebophrya sp. A120]|nr:unnamed protein product [Amoebophrya sp. A120]|eukprot:GSA120T00005276001.1
MKQTSKSFRLRMRTLVAGIVLLHEARTGAARDFLEKRKPQKQHVSPDEDSGPSPTPGSFSSWLSKRGISYATLMGHGSDGFLARTKKWGEEVNKPRLQEAAKTTATAAGGGDPAPLEGDAVVQKSLPPKRAEDSDENEPEADHASGCEGEAHQLGLAESDVTTMGRVEAADSSFLEAIQPNEEPEPSGQQLQQGSTLFGGDDRMGPGDRAQPLIPAPNFPENDKALTIKQSPAISVPQAEYNYRSAAQLAGQESEFLEPVAWVQDANGVLHVTRQPRMLHGMWKMKIQDGMRLQAPHLLPGWEYLNPDIMPPRYLVQHVPTQRNEGCIGPQPSLDVLAAKRAEVERGLQTHAQKLIEFSHQGAMQMQAMESRQEGEEHGGTVLTFRDTVTQAEMFLIAHVDAFGRMEWHLQEKDTRQRGIFKKGGGTTVEGKVELAARLVAQDMYHMPPHLNFLRGREDAMEADQRQFQAGAASFLEGGFYPESSAPRVLGGDGVGTPRSPSRVAALQTQQLPASSHEAALSFLDTHKTRAQQQQQQDLQQEPWDDMSDGMAGPGVPTAEYPQQDLAAPPVQRFDVQTQIQRVRESENSLYATDGTFPLDPYIDVLTGEIVDFPNIPEPYRGKRCPGDREVRKNYFPHNELRRALFRSRHPTEHWARPFVRTVKINREVDTEDACDQHYEELEKESCQVPVCIFKNEQQNNLIASSGDEHGFIDAEGYWISFGAGTPAGGSSDAVALEFSTEERAGPPHLFHAVGDTNLFVLDEMGDRLEDVRAALTSALVDRFHAILPHGAFKISQPDFEERYAETYEDFKAGFAFRTVIVWSGLGELMERFDNGGGTGPLAKFNPTYTEKKQEQQLGTFILCTWEDFRAIAAPNMQEFLAKHMDVRFLVFAEYSRFNRQTQRMDEYVTQDGYRGYALEKDQRDQVFVFLLDHQRLTANELTLGGERQPFNAGLSLYDRAIEYVQSQLDQDQLSTHNPQGAGREQMGGAQPSHRAAMMYLLYRLSPAVSRRDVVMVADEEPGNMMDDLHIFAAVEILREKDPDPYNVQVDPPRSHFIFPARYEELGYKFLPDSFQIHQRRREELEEVAGKRTVMDLEEMVLRHQDARVRNRELDFAGDQSFLQSQQPDATYFEDGEGAGGADVAPNADALLPPLQDPLMFYAELVDELVAGERRAVENWNAAVQNGGNESPPIPFPLARYQKPNYGDENDAWTGDDGSYCTPTQIMHALFVVIYVPHHSLARALGLGDAAGAWDIMEGILATFVFGEARQRWNFWGRAPHLPDRASQERLPIAPPPGGAAGGMVLGAGGTHYYEYEMPGSRYSWGWYPSGADMLPHGLPLLVRRRGPGSRYHPYRNRHGPQHLRNDHDPYSHPHDPYSDRNPVDYGIGILVQRVPAIPIDRSRGLPIGRDGKPITLGGLNLGAGAFGAGALGAGAAGAGALAAGGDEARGPGGWGPGMAGGHPGNHGAGGLMSSQGIAGSGAGSRAVGSPLRGNGRPEGAAGAGQFYEGADGQYGGYGPNQLYGPGGGYELAGSLEEDAKTAQAVGTEDTTVDPGRYAVYYPQSGEMEFLSPDQLESRAVSGNAPLDAMALRNHFPHQTWSDQGGSGYFPAPTPSGWWDLSALLNDPFFQMLMAEQGYVLCPDGRSFCPGTDDEILNALDRNSRGLLQEPMNPLATPPLPVGPILPVSESPPVVVPLSGADGSHKKTEETSACKKWCIILLVALVILVMCCISVLACAVGGPAEEEGNAAAGDAMMHSFGALQVEERAVAFADDGMMDSLLVSEEVLEEEPLSEEVGEEPADDDQPLEETQEEEPPLEDEEEEILTEEPAEDAEPPDFGIPDVPEGPQGDAISTESPKSNLDSGARQTTSNSYDAMFGSRRVPGGPLVHYDHVATKDAHAGADDDSDHLLEHNAPTLPDEDIHDDLSRKVRLETSPHSLTTKLGGSSSDSSNPDGKVSFRGAGRRSRMASEKLTALRAKAMGRVSGKAPDSKNVDSTYLGRDTTQPIDMQRGVDPRALTSGRAETPDRLSGTPGAPPSSGRTSSKPGSSSGPSSGERKSRKKSSVMSGGLRPGGDPIAVNSNAFAGMGSESVKFRVLEGKAPSQVSRRSVGGDKKRSTSGDGRESSKLAKSRRKSSMMSGGVKQKGASIHSSAFRFQGDDAVQFKVLERDAVWPLNIQNVDGGAGPKHATPENLPQWAEKTGTGQIAELRSSREVSGTHQPSGYNFQPEVTTKNPVSGRSTIQSGRPSAARKSSAQMESTFLAGSGTQPVDMQKGVDPRALTSGKAEHASPLHRPRTARTPSPRTSGAQASQQGSNARFSSPNSSTFLGRTTTEPAGDRTSGQAEHASPLHRPRAGVAQKKKKSVVDQDPSPPPRTSSGEIPAGAQESTFLGRGTTQPVDMRKGADPRALTSGRMEHASHLSMLRPGGVAHGHHAHEADRRNSSQGTPDPRLSSQEMSINPKAMKLSREGSSSSSSSDESSPNQSTFLGGGTTTPVDMDKGVDPRALTSGAVEHADKLRGPRVGKKTARQVHGKKSAGDAAQATGAGAAAATGRSGGAPGAGAGAASPAGSPIGAGNAASTGRSGGAPGAASSAGFGRWSRGTVSTVPLTGRNRNERGRKCTIRWSVRRSTGRGSRRSVELPRRRPSSGRCRRSTGNWSGGRTTNRGSVDLSGRRRRRIDGHEAVSGWCTSGWCSSVELSWRPSTHRRGQRSTGDWSGGSSTYWGTDRGRKCTTRWAVRRSPESRWSVELSRRRPSRGCRRWSTGDWSTGGNATNGSIVGIPGPRSQCRDRECSCLCRTSG